jgi:hypothetical protein
MSTIQEPRVRCIGKSQVDGCVEGAFPRGGAACVLFLLLDCGITPDAFDVMAAISEIVAFSTDCDSNNYCSAQIKHLLPGKSCSSC